MKIIVSSEVLRKALVKAFEVDAHCIKTYPDFARPSGTLTFGTKKYQSDFDIQIQFATGSFIAAEVIRFDSLKMAKLLLFLKTIKEQPILIELDSETVRIEICIIDF